MDQDKLSRFLAIAKKITDFNPGGIEAGPGLTGESAAEIDEMGVPVIFKEDVRAVLSFCVCFGLVV